MAEPLPEAPQSEPHGPPPHVPQPYAPSPRLRSRREWLRTTALGVLAAGTAGSVLEGCAAGEGPAGPTAAGTTTVGTTSGALTHADLGPPLQPAPEFLPLLQPLRPGDVLEEKWRLLAIERWHDGHLRIKLVDVQHGGPLELELFRAPAADQRDQGPRPLARTAQWDLYSYDGARGDRAPMVHVQDIANQIALYLADNEATAPALALADQVIRFAARDQRAR